MSPISSISLSTKWQLVGEQKIRLSTLLTNLNKGASVTRMLSLLYSLILFIQQYFLRFYKKIIITKEFHVKNILLKFKEYCNLTTVKMRANSKYTSYEYFGKVFKRVTVAVNPQYTSSYCSSCGEIGKITLSTRTHVCKCGCVMDRDENAARNILSRGLGTVGHTGTFALDASKAWGDQTATLVGANLFEQVMS
ncbi:zinc ribbon domain-containing protein [Nostoc sp.]|uniref:zinc ribbon domain-containing protein n=1 Tax=Nostoc sp. TaxID=1180 RepID=UPI003FA5319A